MHVAINSSYVSKKKRSDACMYRRVHYQGLFMAIFSPASYLKPGGIYTGLQFSFLRLPNVVWLGGYICS